MTVMPASTYRKYGRAPFDVAVLHGGPGACGEMAPVARELASGQGVLEPFQTATSIGGQINELRSILETHAKVPVTLIGFSWGAWLGALFASDCPEFVKKLILVGSGPFDESYSTTIQKTRLDRLGDDERIEFEELMKRVTDPTAGDASSAFGRIGQLILNADSYDPDLSQLEAVDCRVGIFQSVWAEAAALRKSGKLLQRAARIRCPVIAIHGDYDPHPAEGVKNPLSGILSRFRFVMIKNCGHTPWIERQAAKPFFRLLKDELNCP